MKPILINGRIFEFPITGVGRFRHEVISEMDKIVHKNEVLLGVPQDAKNVPRLENIQVQVIGKRTGIFWEQVELPRYAHKNKMKCLSMSSSVPLLAHDYVLIHDISLKVNREENASLKDKVKIWWPLLQYRVGIHKSELFFTDTEFQKKEIEKEYKTNKQINVVYAGWQHMSRIDYDDQIIKRLNLENKEYYFAVSTRGKNKNFKWILEVAKRNQAARFVVAGKLDTKYFADDTNLDGLDNILTTGYVTDSEMKSLMKHAKAFLYPSIYEGFGMPPMEAMAVGTKAIVGKASCLPEVYGDSVYWVDPYHYDVDLESLISNNVGEPNKLLKRYSWEKTAKRIINSINGG